MTIISILMIIILALGASNIGADSHQIWWIVDCTFSPITNPTAAHSSF
jgi:hypothetical protein